MDCKHEFREMTGGRVCEKCGHYQKRRFLGGDPTRSENFAFDDTSIKMRPKRDEAKG